MSRFTLEITEIVDGPAMIADPHYRQLKILPDSLRLQVYLVVKEKIIELCPETEEQSATAEDNQEAT